jgi:hypothetical protein
MWNYGSYRHFVRLLIREISPIARPLPTQDNRNAEKCGQTYMPPVTFEATIEVLEWAKKYVALDRGTATFTNGKYAYSTVYRL